jgi:hypothetical protein
VPQISKRSAPRRQAESDQHQRQRIIQEEHTEARIGGIRGVRGGCRTGGAGNGCATYVCLGEIKKANNKLGWARPYLAARNEMGGPPECLICDDGIEITAPAGALVVAAKGALKTVIGDEGRCSVRAGSVRADQENCV